MADHEHGSRSGNWSRLDGIDLLRGLAILLVLLNHVNMRLFLAAIPYTEGLPAQLVSSLVWKGQYGVQIFFCVSGFLITSTSLRRWSGFSGRSVREFYWLRFARIAPLLLLLLAILSALHAAAVSDFVVPAKAGGLGAALEAALSFRLNVFEARHGYLPANWDILWSLSVEEMFYLFFPLLCWLLGYGKRLVAVLLIFVALGPFGRTVFAANNEVWQEYSYLGGMDAIALGCLSALLLTRVQLSRIGVRILGGAGTGLLAISLCCSIPLRRWGLGRSGLDMSILAVATCMIIAAVERSGWASPRALFPLLRMGRRSYEIYLTHMFVVFALFDGFMALGQPRCGVPWLFIAAILAAGLLGELVARYFSEPMNRWLRDRWGAAAALGAAISRRAS